MSSVATKEAPAPQEVVEEEAVQDFNSIEDLQSMVSPPFSWPASQKGAFSHPSSSAFRPFNIRPHSPHSTRESM
jgi:hypothetical protein